MKTHSTTAEKARQRLVEVAGTTSQDLGLGRIVGQILAYLYLTEGECSLDEIGENLGLSKAAISIAIRQLESMGLVRRSWKKGDRKNYYRSADNIGSALQNGLLSFAKQKMKAVATELEHINELLQKVPAEESADSRVQFLTGRVKRAKQLGDTALSMLENPILNFFVKS